MLHVRKVPYDTLHLHSSNTHAHAADHVLPMEIEGLGPCTNAILDDVAKSEVSTPSSQRLPLLTAKPPIFKVVYVITWSGGSRGAFAGYDGKAFSGLHHLRALIDHPTIRVLVDAKGSSCDQLPKSLMAWAQATQRVHCIEGPNMGAREAHTVFRFCTIFYNHLPRRAVIFMQDDPELGLLKKAGALSV